MGGREANHDPLAIGAATSGAAAQTLRDCRELNPLELVVLPEEQKCKGYGPSSKRHSLAMLRGGRERAARVQRDKSRNLILIRGYPDAPAVRVCPNCRYPKSCHHRQPERTRQHCLVHRAHCKRDRFENVKPIAKLYLAPDLPGGTSYDKTVF